MASDEKEFDEFTEFESGAQTTTSQEWNAFGEENNEEANDTGDDWANFASTSQTPEVSVETKTAPITLSTVKLPSYARILSDRNLIFDLVDERNLIYEDDGIASTSISLADSILEGNQGNERFSCTELYRTFCTIDDSASLKHSWQGSSLYQQVLRLLHVDEAVAMMQKMNMPAFAAHMSIRGGMPLQPISANASNASNDSQRKSCDKQTVESLAVEPAQFDWNSAGLANPLTSHTGIQTSTAMMLDLDFLANKEYDKNREAEQRQKQHKQQQQKSSSAKSTPKLKQRQIEGDFDIRMLQQDKAQQNLIQEALQAKALKEEQAARVAVGVPVSRNGVKKPTLVQPCAPSLQPTPVTAAKNTTRHFQQSIETNGQSQQRQSNIDLLMSNLIFPSAEPNKQSTK